MRRMTGALLFRRLHEQALTNPYAIAFQPVPFPDLIRGSVELAGDQRKRIAALDDVVKRLFDEGVNRFAEAFLARCFLALGVMDRVDVTGKRVQRRLLSATGGEFAAGYSWMRNTHTVSSKEVQTASSQVEQRVVGEFLREYQRRGVRVLDLAPRSDPDKNEAIIGRV